MNIHEFQAKALLRDHGVPVPRGEVARSADRVCAIAERLGPTVVVKAQIHAGGRGKGRFRREDEGSPLMRPGTDEPLGGVVVVDGPERAEQVAAMMLGNVLVTRQTGAEGRVVRQLLIEEGMQIADEYYLALLLDRAAKSITFIVSAEGGMEIEQVAAERPDAILKVSVDTAAGYSPWIGRRIAYFLGMEPAAAAAAGKLAESLYACFIRTDASLVEVNPLVRTKDGRVLALDAKMNFDDNALYRQTSVAALRDLSEEDPLEVEASKHGLNYIKLDGTVGCMVNGAGLAMGTMDIIKHHGGNPANFLDVGGGATSEMVANAFRILLGDPHVRAVLINIFGGIMRCDIVAEGVVNAAREVGVTMPVVVRLAGTNVERGRQILRESGLRFQVAGGMDEAARLVVAAAGRG
ncbi:MAG TPA: ADP-forming succinate--CoA ligase subunit beta [Candidatus Polarisedimenticolaceae bacterium]|nr:ADP-forming succinate--CoA ligase subunit beta [Candidatus Polarisedimenticolaceae bacterium]